MKKAALVLSVVLVFVAGIMLTQTLDLAAADDTSLAGRYVGYSWQGEARGVEFQDAERYIETILTLNDEGVIQDAKMRFFVKMDGYWTTRQSGNAYVDVDFTVDPEPAVPGDNYTPGESMFTVYTADMMSFYAVAVDSSQKTAVAIVCPVTRYQYEIKLSADFDFDTEMSEVTVGSGMLVPTVRTSGSGLLKPSDWEELEDNTIFDMIYWSHVISDYGVLQGIDTSSSVREFLEALGVEFDGDRPQEMEAEYGYHSLGGWSGNYEAIEEYLIGKDATEQVSLVDWSINRYQGGINEDNIFGVDVESGATRTAQDSFDGISGATVRMSRESTSYQRALVEAGILSEEDVIIGRF